MVKSAHDGSSSTSVAPFLKKCYEMVDDGSTDSIISWSRTGDNSFVIWDITEFSVGLLPKFFKHSNFSSFIRQLNIYGFRKVDADRWEFANDGFVRGQKDAMKTITRRKNVQSLDQRKSSHKQENTSDQLEKPENSELWKDVENLKSDKNVMMQELIKLRQYQETADGKLLNLKDRVQGMEESQQQMLSFLVMVMQNPSLLVQLLQPKESSWRVTEATAIVEEVTEEGESLPTSLPLVTYQPPQNGTVKPVVSNSTELVGSVSSDMLKDFIRNADMMKICVDENHVPLIIPDLYDDGAWEKLLLLSPSKKSAKNATLDEERSHGDSTMEVETDKRNMLELILREMERSDDEFEGEDLDPEKSRNLDLLTEQMELLASEETQLNV
ncbi:PREDICTED: heat stress transcription factor A-8 [Tarenaya hassleriana]|uniref:heat stress transcription factor A-8 n=1 Tax=Tarenaya hassleriana TaxID=28532 RepID=UPI00053C5377|nr:PREDICTED: heat stress transcription factor A-8 [Tarenaya hassleriana]XP_010556233.1 PREDICTED: heat stress transcription factor A-8 [Tarenaya hassleriana]